jgi:hypothetical protein
MGSKTIYKTLGIIIVMRRDRFSPPPENWVFVNVGSKGALFTYPDGTNVFVEGKAADDQINKFRPELVANARGDGSGAGLIDPAADRQLVNDYCQNRADGCYPSGCEIEYLCLNYCVGNPRLSDVSAAADKIRGLDV